MEKKKKFKIVFLPDTNTYELWIIDHNGEWGLSHMFGTFTLDGKVIESKYDSTAMINEGILWEMDYLESLGYEFIGIERNQNQ